MSPDHPPPHLQRDRAESFGAIAANYDRFRPSYPDRLIDDLVALRPARVLDIGCGTGKAARLLAARGLSVLGVEVDPQMADVARGHGLDVETGGFESWDDRGRTFDLIISAQAWHWIDPAIGGPKAAGLMTADATMVLFWNDDDIDLRAQAAVDAVCAEVAPDVAPLFARGTGDRTERPYITELEATGAFASITVRRYAWQAVLPADEWVNRVATHSAYLALEPERRSALTQALRTALLAIGGDVHIDGRTYTLWVRP